MDPHNITSKIHALKIVGGIESIDSKSGTLQILGGIGLDGSINTTKDIKAHTMQANTLNVEKINLINDNKKNGYVLKSNDDGEGTWKSNYFFSNDNPQLIDTPSDNNIWTYQNIGIGITNPEEMFHINTTSAGQGALIGNMKIGRWLDDPSSNVLVHKDLKNESSSYSLRQNSSGSTFINSKTQLEFRLNDALEMVLNEQGYLGIGITNPQESLHVAENCIIQGNLEVQGSTITFDTETLVVEDPMIHVANGNIGDIVDIGLYGSYIESGVTKYCAFFRDASEQGSKFKLIENLQDAPTTTITGNYDYSVLRLGGMEELVGITFNNNAHIKHDDLTFSYGTRPGPYEPYLFFKNGNVGFGVTEPQAAIDLKGNLIFDGILGVGISNPAVSIDNEATDAIRLPSGTNIERPNPPKLGYFRYNTDRNAMEIYNDSGWALPARVVDEDGDTYIDPEKMEDDDTLRFYTYNTQRMVINGDGWIGIGVTNPEIALDMTGHVNAFGVPSGTISERPTNPKAGFMRYNSELTVLEAYDGSGWFDVAGGTIDFDQDTKIITESSIGNDDDYLRFITKGEDRIIITDNGLVGIGTLTPNITLEINATDGIRLPLGTSSERPSIEEKGQIRYNTELDQFEGFGAGNAWGSLGGVKDIDQDTYITAELNSDEDKIRVVTQDVLRMIIDNSGNVGIGVTNPTVKLDVSGDIQANNINVANNVIITGDLTVSGNNTIISTTSLTVDDTMIQLGMSNISDDLDCGIFGQFVENGVTKYTGCVRDADDGIYKLFTNLEDIPGTIVDTNGTGYTKATFQVGKLDTESIDYPVDLNFNNDIKFGTNGFIGIGGTPTYPLHITKNNVSNWSTKITNGSVNLFVANTNGMGMSLNTGVDNTNLQYALQIANSSISPLFQINNSGKVGISTSAPNKLFHVYTTSAGEGAKIGNAFTGCWTGLNSSTVFAHSEVSDTSGSYAIKQTITGETSINTASNKLLKLCVNDVAQITVNPTGPISINNGATFEGDITTSGNIGIGLISSPSSLLHLKKMAADTYINIDTESDISYNCGIKLQKNGIDKWIIYNDSEDDALYFNTNSTNRLAIDINGNIGIGITSSDNRLHVHQNNSNSCYAHFTNSTTGTTATKGAIIGLDSSENMVIWSYEDKELYFGNNNNRRMTINNNGNIGIGINNPTYLLHVNGDTRIDGNVSIGGSISYDGVSVESLFFQDSLLKFASENTSDLIDIGFYGLYEQLGVPMYCGIFRDRTDNKFKLYVDSETEPTTEVNISATGYTDATLVLGDVESSGAVSAVDFTTTSDKRAKENIIKLNNNKCLENINNLDVYQYEFKDTFRNLKKPKRKHQGLIAQEVEKIIPEAVYSNAYKDIDDFKSINQNTIISQLIGCIHALTDRISKLETQMLKNRLDNIIL